MYMHSKAPNVPLYDIYILITIHEVHNFRLRLVIKQIRSGQEVSYMSFVYSIREVVLCWALIGFDSIWTVYFILILHQAEWKWCEELVEKSHEV